MLVDVWSRYRDKKCPADQSMSAIATYVIYLDLDLESSGTAPPRVQALDTW